MLEEATEALGQAIALDPADLSARLHAGFVHFLAARYEEALAATDEVIRRTPTPWGHYQAAISRLRLGDLAGAKASAGEVERSFPTSVLIHSLRGLIAAVEGDRVAAEEGVERIAANRQAFGHYHHAQHDAAVIFAQLGKPGEALAWLARAAVNGFPCHPTFERDPLLVPLRGENTFRRLMERLRSECDGYRRLYHELRPASSGGVRTRS